MGWSFGCTSKKQQVSELLTHTAGSRGRKVLKHSLRGNVLWTVEEIGPALDGSQGSVRFIGCYLLSCHEGEWGYKSMEESMEPYYYTVPQSYFKMVPESEPDVRPEWRKEVIERQRIESLVRLRQIPMDQIWCRRYGRSDLQVAGYYNGSQILAYVEGHLGLYRVPHGDLKRPSADTLQGSSLPA